MKMVNSDMSLTVAVLALDCKLVSSQPAQAAYASPSISRQRGIQRGIQTKQSKTITNHNLGPSSLFRPLLPSLPSL